jgi:uncharacterized delta-60 repeat protein
MTRPNRTILGALLRACAVALAVATALLAPAASAAAATSGSLYPSFGSSGFAVEPLGTESVGVQSVVQPDGKIVVVGAATVNGQNDMVATRLRPNGTQDNSFGSNGWTIIPIGQTAQGNAIALQSNGDIVLAGAGRDPSVGTVSLAAARLTPNGSLDSTFGRRGVVTVPVGAAAMGNGVVVQSDGKIVVSGTALTDHNHFVATRLNSNGNVDHSFANNGIALLSAVTAADWGLALQSNGDLVLGGEEQNSAGSWQYMVARLQPNGNPDPSFGTGGSVILPIGSSAAGLALALQPDGRILLTGNAVVNGTRVVATVRFNTDGSLDGSFGSGGISEFAGTGAQAIAMEGSNIVLAGPGATAVRLTPGGARDTTFGNRGLASAVIGTNDAANGVIVDPIDGTIVLSGVATVNQQIELTAVKLYG